MIVRRLGLAPYAPTWRAMREFTAARTPDTPDELWQLQHPPVYTVGVAGRDQHLPRVDNGIPVVRTDRGGQITYHGPGQVVLYTLLDLQRRSLSVHGFVRLLEGAVIDLLGRYGIADAHGRTDAPGVYVGQAKIAALGLRIRHGRCYHGLALNIAMDLTPFAAIDPCGYPKLPVTSLQALGVDRPTDEIAQALVDALARRIGAEVSA
ncbi:MAG: lipoyl(octanoyl) transferase LipB [Betaproteobacteria bacterium]|nr:lipoyl(octanoyl) transferase LipB [Betaproteobacteria bacterium]